MSSLPSGLQESPGGNNMKNYEFEKDNSDNLIIFQLSLEEKIQRSLSIKYSLGKSE